MSASDERRLAFTACDEGTVVLWCRNRPARVSVDGRASEFEYDRGVVRISLAQGRREYAVEIVGHVG